MKNDNQTINSFFTSKNLHLITSTGLLIPIALAYGINPQKILFVLFGIKVETINLSNIFRAVMGLYLGQASLWILGIVKSDYWVGATLANIFFMGGLAFGRILSLLFDGSPSFLLIMALLAELALAAWGFYSFKKYKTAS